jgi:hypothetical protein
MMFVDSMIAPAVRAAAVAPHDVNALAELPKALFVGSGGHLVVRGAEGAADVVFKNLPDAALLPFRALFVRATGTTAGDIVALY